MEYKILIVMLLLTIAIAILTIIAVYIEFKKLHENDEYIKKMEKSRERLMIENLEQLGYINALKRVNEIQQHLLQTNKNK